MRCFFLCSFDVHPPEAAGLISVGGKSYRICSDMGSDFVG